MVVKLHKPEHNCSTAKRDINASSSTSKSIFRQDEQLFSGCHLRTQASGPPTDGNAEVFFCGCCFQPMTNWTQT